MEEGTVVAEKKAVFSYSALPDGDVKRIFIGGVGVGVALTDLENTFSSLGKVHAVDFVHTHGRSFAFMDFEPFSIKSLAKLFSAYNGCTWKGGKLKLELAKEHYLSRLKREWAENDKLAFSSAPTEEKIEFTRSDHLNQEKSQIRIFFPKLRKVKALPFKGTGKHKYSFQRVEVPPLPIHFCDCEEHSKALEAASQTYLAPLKTVVHERERNIIINVINKLIEGDKDEASLDRKVQVASDSKLSKTNDGDINSDEADIVDTDDENLVMNIGAGTEDDILMRLKGEIAHLTGQESETRKPQSSKWGLDQNKADSGKKKKSEVTNASSSLKPSKKARSEPELGITQKLISSEDPSRQNSSKSQPPEGHSWLQKSSWKDLVGGNGGDSFSISSLLSGGITKSAASDPIPVKNPESLAKGVSKIRAGGINSAFEKGSKESSSGRKIGMEFSFAEVCPFMRSADSEQQWAKAKAALSGLLKCKGKAPTNRL